ncbi:hypothetical protein IPA_07635 [Ignicoccus pacificus DSM 13166]|uniref:PaREP1 family protein n=1 Tax=Ignicoccus pacificus DSM 13166 TaxID=940294 RepID=A0A977KBU0_9CREN|nr:hypothetical protein IPA_07635 [Ignicoccus pacificus DSM 13166]
MEKTKEKLEEPAKDNFIKKKIEDSIYEAFLAKKLAEEGLIRNACGKAFQSWKDLISALLYLKKEEILQLLKDERQKEWFLKKGIYAPSSKLRVLSSLLEDIGLEDISAWTDKALYLHTYQYNGPDPEGLWGGPADKEEALDSLKRLLRKWKEIMDKHFGNYLDEDLRKVLESV